MAPQRVGADGQDDVPAVIDRDNEQEPGRMAKARRIESGRPLAARSRRHERMSR
jgi:hypothetical protein